MFKYYINIYINQNIIVYHIFIEKYEYVFYTNVLTIHDVEMLSQKEIIIDIIITSL